MKIEQEKKGTKNPFMKFMKKITFNEQEIKKIKEMYEEQSIPTTKIAKKYKVDYSVILRILRQNGTVVRTSGESQKYKFTEVEEEDIVIMYEERKSMLRISKKYGVSHQVIKRILKKNNVKIRTSAESKTKILTKEQIEQIIRLYLEEELSMLRISKKYNVTPDKINKILKDNNVKKEKQKEKPKTRLTKEEYKEIEEMKKNGVDTETILMIYPEYKKEIKGDR